MELHTCESNYCTTKIAIAAKLSGRDLIFVQTTPSDLLGLDLRAKGQVLKAVDGILTQHLSILRYIVSLNPMSILYRHSLFLDAVVNQWLDFAWTQLDTPIQLLRRRNVSNLCNIDSSLFLKATQAIHAGLEILTLHLASQTFMVDERLSLADICLYCSLIEACSLINLDLRAFPALRRWLFTVGHQPGVLETCPPPEGLWERMH